MQTVNLESVPGFGPKLIERVAERWPDLLNDAELRRNPYLLTDIPRVGFRLADTAAQAVGIPANSQFRYQAAAVHVLIQAEQAGHTALTQPWFDERIAAALNVTTPPAVTIDNPRVTYVDGLLSRTKTLGIERLIALKVRAMLDRGDPAPLNFSDYKLAEDQIQALRAARRAPLFILTGSPGTGKTTAIKAIVDRIDEGTLALAAPTGKAAKRIEEVTGVAARTIHRMLVVVAKPKGHNAEDDGIHDEQLCRLCFYQRLPFAHSPGFKFAYNRDNQLPHDVVVVDEASMIDVRLMADLCEALRPSARLILVGDVFQLPSVGPGSVLRDLIRAGAPSFELTTLKRQDPDLLIARNCRLIRHERRIATANGMASDFFFLACEDPAEIARLAVEYHTERIPRRAGCDPMTQIVTLAALKEHGALCTAALNLALRRRLNHNIQDALLDPQTPGDRVIQTKNDYQLEVMNGEAGTIEALDGKFLLVRFDNPTRIVRIPRDDNDLILAWALTVHKAQGSEWPWIVIPIHEEQGRMVPNAQWLYTAISRARDGCVVIGQRKVLDRIAADHRPSRRLTRLAAMVVKSKKNAPN